MENAKIIDIAEQSGFGSVKTFNQLFKEKHNMSPVQYLNSLGILDSNFISAHTVLVNDEDIQILKEKGVGVSHNIGANAKGAKGVSPIIKMKKMKVLQRF